MTRAGWKEQATTLQVPAAGGGEALVLEAAWQTGQEPAAVVAPPHPEFGGSLDNPVVNEIAYALHQEGLASLRFNWRGVGASQGHITGDVNVGEADYAAALDHVAASRPGPITACGYSFGAAVALRVASRDDRIGGLILVAPPTRMVEDLDLAALGRPVSVITGGQDSFAPPRELIELFDVPTAHVDVIPEADHFFVSAGLAELSQLVRSAYARSS